MHQNHWKTPTGQIILHEHKIDWEDSERALKLLEEIKILHKHGKNKEYSAGEIDMFERVISNYKQLMNRVSKDTNACME